ncbi:MAG: anaerobic ribonucleoside-triphosphate reductase activating protein [Bacillota bacterium]
MNEEKKIRLAGITPESVVDGNGIRYVIWAQGCNHRCHGCHSPQTWDFDGGQLRDMDDILSEIRRDGLLKGVTFSGGDPLEQAEKFAYMAKKVRECGLDVWCYTGYTFEFILENMDRRKGWKDLLENVDVLVDGRFEPDKKDLRLAFKGSKNQRIIDLPRSMQSSEVVLLDLEKEKNNI